jgi:ferritin-like metal-binding protein YciE
MQINSAQDLLTAELRDIYSAEKQASRALPKLSKAVSSDKLRQMIDRRKDEGAKVLEALDQIFQESETRPGRKKCEAMEGLIEEANEHIENINDDHVLDAALVGALQRIEHYCIASWGTAAALAKVCGLEDGAKRLSDLIEAGRTYDQDLTKLAESEINPAMMAGDVDDEGDDELEEDDDQPKARNGGAKAGSTVARKTRNRGEAQA